MGKRMNVPEENDDDILKRISVTVGNNKSCSHVEQPIVGETSVDPAVVSSRIHSFEKSAAPRTELIRTFGSLKTELLAAGQQPAAGLIAVSEKELETAAPSKSLLKSIVAAVKALTESRNLGPEVPASIAAVENVINMSDF